MSKRTRYEIDDEQNDTQTHKRQKVEDEEKEIPDIEQLTFFTKKIYSTKANKIIETKYAVFEDTTYRAKYSQNKKYQTRGNEKKWICSKEGCKGEIQTSDDPNVPYNKMHNGDCDSNERITNVRKENSLSRMKQAPRIAYETEILLFPNCAVYGCGFHYCKALLKNIGDHGLAKTHKSNPEFRYLIRKYMMLMLVPSDMVQTAWDELSEQAKKTVPKLIG